MMKKIKNRYDEKLVLFALTINAGVIITAVERIIHDIVGYTMVFSNGIVSSTKIGLSLVARGGSTFDIDIYAAVSFAAGTLDTPTSEALETAATGKIN